MRTRRSYQEIAEDFEGEVLGFLRKIGFDRVEGGRTHKIGGHQIDASAIHENTLLVIECVVRTKGAHQSLRAKIRALRGMTYDIRAALGDNGKFADVKQMRLILATTKSGFRKDDGTFAAKNPCVSIWDENFITYYKSLHQKVGEYAKFNLLAELQIQPTEKRPLRFPCMRVRIYDHVMYSFFAPPKALLRVSYVARRGRAEEEYYQRLVDGDRITAIADEFLNRKGIFPNSVLLSFNKRAKFTPIRALSGRAKSNLFKKADEQGDLWREVEFGLLALPRDYRSCWIIDGQHRLYSFGQAKESIEQKISVIAFEGLPLSEQAKYFVEVNSNQKPVPADLLWDLKGELMPRSPDGVISRVAKLLNQRGVLQNRIGMPKIVSKEKGKKLLRFAGMCINIRRRKLTSRQTEHMKLIKDKNPLFNQRPDVTVRRVSPHCVSILRCSIAFSQQKKSENSGSRIVELRLLAHCTSACC